ncbi:NHL repeat-containing protein [Niabella ginsengisoli]|uniref:6-bladed beta-propeller n=1 Tax=Niabella ginsengisoli TaxID=522298 RepID=A0ABS9SGJ5_9BACT|nr:6-bladed beta-propeller [Niabella ginsengisoli]MCH5597493.1 6-bladed beta-propeller [Niabella ginsengisoli]
MNKRNFLKTATILTTAIAAKPAAAFGINKKLKLEDDVLIGHGGFKYKVHKNWAKISPAHNPLFNCHEMVMDSKGRLIMIGDHTNNNILVFDKSGKLLDFWGTQYPGGHGLSIGKEGEADFLVITDCGYFQDKNGGWQRQSGQVFKTTIDGKLIFNFGHPHAIGVYKADERFQPTETAVAPNGDIYVADGYGSDYIIQYDARGKYIRHFGGHNNSNPDHNLKNAHGVAIDNRDKNNPVLVCTSRSEQCFKFFTLDGKYIKTIAMPGLYVCRAVIDDKNIYAGVCWSDKKDGQKQAKDSGFVTILDNANKVVSNPGGTEPQYVNGQLQQMFQTSEKIFNHGHDVCVDDDKNVYVCQWNANQTAPIKLERV